MIPLTITLAVVLICLIIAGKRMFKDVETNENDCSDLSDVIIEEHETHYTDRNGVRVFSSTEPQELGFNETFKNIHSQLN